MYTIRKIYGYVQDSITENWLVYLFGRSIGYFPASLFSKMSATTSMGMPSPPMGSGFRPQDPGAQISYFRKVAFRDDSKTEKGPRKDMTPSFSNKPGCYGAAYYGDQLGNDMGFSLGFGGPGGNCAN